MDASESITDRAPVISSHSPGVRLAVMKGPGEGGSIVVRRAASIIGSRTGVKVRLKHPDVSGVHAVVINTGEAVFLRDLASDNGTFLNDLRAEHERLGDGDVIKIKPWQFSVAIHELNVDSSSDFTGLGLDPAPSAIALEEVKTGRIIKMPRDVSLIGRRAGADLLVEDRSVSRAHAVIFTYLSKPVVFDLDSGNGTFVNDKRISFCEFDSDAIIKFGTAEFRARVIGPNSRVETKSNGQVIAPPMPEGTYSDRIDIRAAERKR
jgi:pSer/pThr/pTyr-binding forkhead associated (FHA) protein